MNGIKFCNVFMHFGVVRELLDNPRPMSELWRELIASKNMDACIAVLRSMYAPLASVRAAHMWALVDATPAIKGMRLRELLEVPEIWNVVFMPTSLPKGYEDINETWEAYFASVGVKNVAYTTQALAYLRKAFADHGVNLTEEELNKIQDTLRGLAWALHHEEPDVYRTDNIRSVELVKECHAALCDVCKSDAACGHALDAMTMKWIASMDMEAFFNKQI